MAEKMGGYVRGLEGKEREGTRVVPRNGRLSLFWDILKARFLRLVLVNLILILSLAPVIAILIWRFMVQGNLELNGPFAGGLGVGFPADLSNPDYLEKLMFRSDIVFFSLFIPASAVFAVALAGAARLLCRSAATEGEFSWRDFAVGIKEGYFGTLIACLLFSFLLFLAQTVNNLAVWYVALGDPMQGCVIASAVLGWIILALFLPVCLWMVALSADYRLSLGSLFKHAFILTVGTFPQSILFSLLSAVPVLLVLLTSSVPFLYTLVLALAMLLGLSAPVLLWENFARWAFDKYCAPARPKAEPVRAQQQAEREEDPSTIRMLSIAFGKSELLSRPILPLDEGTAPVLLPEEYTAADLKALFANRAKMEEELRAYEEAYGGEEEYREYNRLFDEREKALDDGKKKCKPKPPKMLNQR